MADADTGGSGTPGVNATGEVNVSSLLADAFSQAKQNYAAIAANGGGGGGGGYALEQQGGQQVAQGQADVATLEGAAQAKLKADNAATAAKFGFLPGAAQTAIAGWAGSLAEDEAQLFQEQEGLRAKLGAGPLSNPLQWLMNQFELPNEIAHYNAGVESINQRFGVLNQLTKQASDEFAVNAAVDQVDGVAKAKALSMIAFGQAKERLSDAAFKAAQIGIQGQSVRLAATRDAFDAAVAVNNAGNESIRNNIALQGLDIQKKELQDRDIQTAIAQDQNARNALQSQTQQAIETLQLKGLNREDAARTVAQAQLDNVTKTFGLNKMTVEQFKMLPDSPLQRLVVQGMIDPNVQAGRLGYDAVTSLNNANINNLPLPGGQQYVREKLNDIVNTWDSQNAFTAKSMPPEAVHAMQMNAIRDSLNRQASNIAPTGNMFSPAPLKSVLEIPAVQATSLAKDLNPLWQANPEYKTDANDFMAAAALKIQQGKATPEQMAAEISQIYNAIIVDTNQRNNYQKFGFSGLNSKTGFLTSVQMTGGFGGTGTLDMSNKAAVEAALTRMIISKQLMEQQVSGPLRAGVIP